MNKGLWYQSMAAADVSGLLTAVQIRDFLEKRHPTSAKKHKIAADVVSDGEMKI